MDLKDTYRYLIGAYFGIREMDEYSSKEYVLKDIEDYIKDFLSVNEIDFDIEKEKDDVLDNVSLKTKLQDALIVLPKVNATLELTLLVKARLKRIREEELEEM